jgi:hypothetical protein
MELSGRSTYLLLGIAAPPHLDHVLPIRLSHLFVLPRLSFFFFFIPIYGLSLSFTAGTDGTSKHMFIPQFY